MGIDRIQALLDAVKPAIDVFKPAINLFKPNVDPLEAVAHLSEQISETRHHDLM
jgi:hypothetical protein